MTAERSAEPAKTGLQCRSTLPTNVGGLLVQRIASSLEGPRSKECFHPPRVRLRHFVTRPYAEAFPADSRKPISSIQIIDYCRAPHVRWRATGRASTESDAHSYAFVSRRMRSLNVGLLGSADPGDRGSFTDRVAKYLRRTRGSDNTSRRALTTLRPPCHTTWSSCWWCARGECHHLRR